MKLITRTLTLQEKIAEFNLWITASLGETKDTPRFEQEMKRVLAIFDTLVPAFQAAKEPTELNAQGIVMPLLALVDGKDEEEAKAILQSLASVLFLATGKSDNNAKCQLPIYLKNVLGWESWPSAQGKKGKANRVVEKSLPRVLKAETYMAQVGRFNIHSDKQERLREQKKLLEAYTAFVISDQSYVSQLWSIGQSYVMLKALGHHESLLNPLVTFQVRGSVAATGGHKPELLLRERLREWGLQDDIDFNLTDAILAENPVTEAGEEGTDNTLVPVEGDEKDEVRAKTRAYDFLLPFKTPGWRPRLFIQSQFYAGDSGSVSHKNVDQTKTSRAVVSRIATDPRFIEYVDGAGYFASLNGDLQRLLTMGDTHSFFQVRSAAIRLRRELQDIGFLTPLEIEHAILRTDGTIARVKEVLHDEGYSFTEIERSIGQALTHAVIRDGANDRLLIAPERYDLARRYLLLDVIANNGKTIERANSKASATVLIPGYGPFFGINLSDLEQQLHLVVFAEKILSDLNWLCTQGMAMF